MTEEITDFGARDVTAADKTRLVEEVFRSVAGRYDLMNDLMSFGVHRLWKRYALWRLAPRPGERILDLAGGTGDMSRLLHPRIGEAGRVVLADINDAMLAIGRDRMIDCGIVKGVCYARANAERLPFAEASFDAVCIAFGLRNVARKSACLEEMHRVLKPGGRALVLEFSRVIVPLLARLYDEYSFRVIPELGRRVAGDAGSYRYLVESIRRHPDQEALRDMMVAAGFDRVGYQNLSGGIVALHMGYRF
jgi:demethylmenaquinone methyltransferase/2-methoxy-6-polyprenyl-1,4-benzoquinol methylase